MLKTFVCGVVSFAVSAAIIALAVPADPVSAQDLPNGSDSTRVALTLVPDCSTLTAEGRKYIEAHEISICGYTPTRGIQPRGTVNGTCGSSFITLQRNTVAPAQIVTQWGFKSTKGPIGFRFLDVLWTYNGKTTSYLDVSPMGGTTYSGSNSRDFGGARVSARLEGSVTTVYGLSCTMKGATSWV